MCMESAFHAVFTLPSSNEPEEGKIKKFKDSKRSMDGRSDCSLLRHKVLKWSTGNAEERHSVWCLSLQTVSLFIDPENRARTFGWIKPRGFLCGFHAEGAALFAAPVRSGLLPQDAGAWVEVAGVY